MSKTHNLEVVTSSAPTLSALDIRKQVNLIQEVMKEVMQGPTIKDGKEIPGVHYGIIPGCKLPSLYKAGAEKLAMTFRLGAEYEELPGSTESENFICYKINCKLFHIPTGNVVGNGRGVCNSKEKKYRTRMVYLNKATAEEKAIGREEERGEGNKKYKVLIVPQDPYDIQNTIYKMGCKRAMVAAIINATGASDIFTQDVEELPEGTIMEEEQPTAGKPAVSMPEEIAYVDILTLSQAKIGDVLNVQGYLVSMTASTTTAPSSYVIGDLPKDPTAQMTVKAFGEALKAEPGQLIKLNAVKVDEYKGKKQATAKEAING